ncbi:MAG: DegT/DnrJ/EryC1/StrS family aminotransferase [Pedosphaera sp.]|nr:DegT/DnrJ/EryC1/StrS family aminotransferase [Pedosphaera sp.]
MDIHRIAAQPLADYLASKSEIDEAIQRVLNSGRYILGPEVESFEREFAREVGAAHCLGVANGTDALVVALRALEIGPGDRVITVSHTAVATVAAIEILGAIPVLVDIDPTSFTIDPNRLEDTLCTPPCAKVKGVIGVHLYGNPADLVALMEITRRHGIRLIEDCAQAHGAMISGRPVGSWGDIAAFSFYPTKNLGAIGDGGAVTTNDPLLADRARQLREYGWQQRYISEIPGLNSRLDELQAAILRVKCRRLAADNHRRQTLAGIYSSELDRLHLTPPAIREGVEHVFHQYVIRSPQRDSLRTYLSGCGVPVAIHYPMPVHLQPAYRNRVEIGAGGLGESEKAAREVLSLPMHPHLTEETVRWVIQTLKAWRP